MKSVRAIRKKKDKVGNNSASDIVQTPSDKVVGKGFSEEVMSDQTARRS